MALAWVAAPLDLSVALGAAALLLADAEDWVSLLLDPEDVELGLPGMFS